MKIVVDRNFGRLQKGYTFELGPGYNVFVGENDVGKSTVLQYIFSYLFDHGSIPNDSYCYIPKERDFIRDNTQPLDGRLDRMNTEIRQAINNEPMRFNDPQVNFNVQYNNILNHADMHKQMQEIMTYLSEDGFGEYKTIDSQRQVVDDIQVIKHGSGLRCLMPIYAAISDPKINYIIIDEPEASLEAGNQKKLKARLKRVCDEREKNIIVATHSHLMLNNEEISNTFTLSLNDSHINICMVEDEAVFKNIAFKMLGNSLSDLFLPDNFLFVEGVSDQIIVEKISELLPVKNYDLRVIACGGIEQLRPTISAFEQNLRPVLEKKSPYSKKLVVLSDSPNEEEASMIKWIDELKKIIKSRYFPLNKPSLEEYLPEELYIKAGLDKGQELERLETVKSDFKKSSSIKKEISTSIASVLTEEDLDSIKIIVDSVKMAKNIK